MLRKEGKKNYLLLKAYKPIVLKKHLSKASKECHYYICYKEGGSESRREKIALYFFSNKFFYLNYSDYVED